MYIYKFIYIHIYNCVSIYTSYFPFLLISLNIVADARGLSGNIMSTLSCLAILSPLAQCLLPLPLSVEFVLARL